MPRRHVAHTKKAIASGPICSSAVITITPLKIVSKILKPFAYAMAKSVTPTGHIVHDLDYDVQVHGDGVACMSEDRNAVC